MLGWVAQSGRETQPCFHIHSKSRSRMTIRVEWLGGCARGMSGKYAKGMPLNFAVDRGPTHLDV